jgi:glycosyltransferase involved in cell wall biosynthesis
MVHEPYLYFDAGKLLWNLAALAHRLMIAILLNASGHVWISIPAWEKRLRPYSFGRKIPFRWLPIPSNVPVIDDADAVSRSRSRYVGDSSWLIGHFGAYDRYSREMLINLLPGLLEDHSDRGLLLLGKGSEAMPEEAREKYPQLAGKMFATGFLEEKALSRHLLACDLFIQPYPDGVSSRRCSTMALLAHARPVITTKGPLTEPLWETSKAVYLADVGNRQDIFESANKLLNDEAERKRLAVEAKRFYEKNFHSDRAITALAEAF